MAGGRMIQTFAKLAAESEGNRARAASSILLSSDFLAAERPVILTCSTERQFTHQRQSDRFCYAKPALDQIFFKATDDEPDRRVPKRLARNFPPLVVVQRWFFRNLPRAFDRGAMDSLELAAGRLLHPVFSRRVLCY